MIRIRRVPLLYFEKWMIYSIVVGVITAFLIILFYKLLVLVAQLFTQHILLCSVSRLKSYDISIVAEYARDYRVVMSIIIGAAISSVIVYSIAPEAEGPGVDSTIRSFHHFGGFIRWRVPFVKMISSSILIGSGGSGGVLGPSIQIGAGAGSIVAGLFRASWGDRRILIVTGMAAALSTIFRAPIGAAIFAMEVLYQRDFETRAFLPVIISSFTAYVIACHIIGFTGFFPTIEVDVRELYNIRSFASIILLSLFCTPIALLYTVLFVGSRMFFESLSRRLGIPRILKPIIGAILLAPIAMVFPQVIGSGKDFLITLFNNVMNDGIPESLQAVAPIGGLVASISMLIILKIIATCLSVGSGGSGGVFAPGLYIGALTGLLFYILIGSRISGLDPVLYMYIAMSAIFGAVSKTPLATSIMITEMSRSYHILVPTLLATVVTRELTGTITIYRAQRLGLLKDDLRVLETILSMIREKGVDIGVIKAGEIASLEVAPISYRSSVGDVLERFIEHMISIIPVVDDNDRIVGVIDYHEYQRLLRLRPDTPLYSIELAEPIMVHEKTPLDKVIEYMIDYDKEYVVVADTERRYRGIITANMITPLLVKKMISSS